MPRTKNTCYIVILFTALKWKRMLAERIKVESLHGKKEKQKCQKLKNYFLMAECQVKTKPATQELAAAAPFKF